MREPLIPAEIPEYPFQNVAADLFEINGYYYLVYVDRLTAFAELAYYSSAPTSSRVIATIREFFHRWGVAEEASLDGGPNLDSSEIKNWLRSWGTRIRKSSAYYAQSNGRAEAGVKSLKRLLMGNTGSRGSINTDAVAQALLQYRNTPLRGVDKSPAELALGRQLRDTLPLPRSRYKISPHWAQYLNKRERTMSEANNKIKSNYDQHARNLHPLDIGDRVRCQNARSKKWDRTGTVLEFNGHRQYTVKLDGSSRASLRNRRHLWKITTNIPETLCIPRDTLIHQISGQRTAESSVPESATPVELPAEAEALVQHTTTQQPHLQNQIEPTASTQNNTTQHFVRRSNRKTAKPNWYHAEFNNS